MKNLLIIIALGVFTGKTLSLKAQAIVNVESLDEKGQQNKSPKFIGDKEIATGDSPQGITAGDGIGKSNSANVTKPSIFKPGYVGNIELCTALQFKYAMLMDTEVESITNLPLYSFIENWWATRYQYGGADRSGIDCSAFTVKLLSEVYGLNAPRTAKDQYAQCEKVSPENLIEGNLVFFNISGGVSHVGLYLGNNYFVHSSVNGGVTISSLTEEYYAKKFIAGGKILMPPTPLASRN